MGVWGINDFVVIQWLQKYIYAGEQYRILMPGLSAMINHDYNESISDLTIDCKSLSSLRTISHII